MTTKIDTRTAEQRAREHFEAEIGEHQMTVLRDNGTHRHIRFARPGTGMYRFDLVTWPGYLVICGDMETFVFSRTEDMFTFFRGGSGRSGINPGYWSQKLVAPRSKSARTFTEEAFACNVRQHLEDDYLPHDLPEDLRAELRAAAEEHVIRDLDACSAEGAYNAASSFRFHWDKTTGKRLDYDWLLPKGHRLDTFQFDEVYEWDNTEYDHHFLWACYAIVWGISQYDQHKATLADYDEAGVPTPEQWVEKFITADRETQRATATAAIANAEAALRCFVRDDESVHARAEGLARALHAADARLIELEAELVTVRAMAGARA